MWTRSTWNAQLVGDAQAVKPENLKLWLIWLIVLGVWLIVSATAYVWLQVERVHLGYQLAELQGKQEQSQAVQRKLQLEYNRWREPFHLEELGRQQFGLSPARDDQRVVSR
jgi:cell division protein FtsL